MIINSEFQFHTKNRNCDQVYLGKFKQQTSQSPMPQLKFALTQQGSLPHASIPLVVSDSLAATSSTYTINKNHHNRLLGTMAHCQTQPNNQSSSQFGEIEPLLSKYHIIFKFFLC